MPEGACSRCPTQSVRSMIIVQAGQKKENREMRKLRLFLMMLTITSIVVGLVPALATAAGPPLETPVKIVIVAPATCALDMWWCVFEQGIWDAAEQLNVDLTVIAPDKVSPEQTAEDMGHAVVFLVSEDAKNITGQALNVDGGRIKN